MFPYFLLLPVHREYETSIWWVFKFLLQKQKTEMSIDGNN